MFEEFERVFNNDRFLTVKTFEQFEFAPTLVTHYFGDRLIGFVAIEDFADNKKSKVGRLSVAILPEYQDKGLGKVIIEEAIAKAFNRGKEKIWLSVYSDNLRAIHLYESLGFILEGVFRNEEWSEEYGYRDVYSMALFKEERTDHIAWGPPDIGAKEIDNVLNCVKTDWYSSGPQAKEFSTNVSRYTGAKYNIPVSNGTTALIAAYFSLFAPKDKVIIPNYTFVATDRAAKLCGLDVILVDVDPRSGMIDLDQVENRLDSEADIKGLVTVSVAGVPSDYEKLEYLRGKYNIKIVEDGAAALGGSGKYKVGEFADITTFSLHASKVITAIEGGLISTNNKVLAEYLRRFVTHGEDPDHKYLFSQFGLNLRTTDINMGIANAQLNKLDRYIEHRNNIVSFYKDALGVNNFQSTPNYVKRHTYMSCLLFVNDKNNFLENAKNFNIEMRPAWYGIKQGVYPNSDYIMNNGVYIPLHNKLTFSEAERITNFCKDYI